MTMPPLARRRAPIQAFSDLSEPLQGTCGAASPSGAGKSSSSIRASSALRVLRGCTPRVPRAPRPGCASVVPASALEALEATWPSCSGRLDAWHEPIASLFNAQGLASLETPKHWALVACQHHPLTISEEHQDNLSALSTRQQQLNAKKSMDRDQQRITNTITKTLKKHQEGSLARQYTDVQYKRQVELMFEPLLGIPQSMFHELAKEMHNEPFAPLLGLPGSSGKDRHMSFKRSMSMLARQSIAGPRRLISEDGDAPVKVGSGGQLTNAQRVLILSVFQRYVTRVSGPGRAELMRRSTWFRFIHHCGLLGPAGGITFVQAAKTFSVFAETWATPPSLTFIGWSAALFRLLRGPGMYQSDEEVFHNLFDVLLRRCEERLQDKATALAAQPSRPGGSTRIRSKTRQAPCPMTPGSTQQGALEPLPDSACLDWHIASAEEQICEPEVLQLFHQYRRPLEGLFKFFVERFRIGEILEGNYSSEASDDSEPAVQGFPGCPGVLSEAAFQTVLNELQIFPEFVQIFSLRQHLTWSNKRIGSIGLDYRVFVECICRIGFLYLTFYGNATQQPAPSKWKCLWVLTMLRVRCRDLGMELGMPDGLVGDNHFDGGLLWRQQSSTRQLDVMPLEDLVFWHAFDHGEASQLPRSPD